MFIKQVEKRSSKDAMNGHIIQKGWTLSADLYMDTILFVVMVYAVILFGLL